MPPSVRAVARSRWLVWPVAVLATLGLLGQASDAAFTDTSSNRGNSLAAVPFFSCGNAVAAATPYLYFRMDETSSTATVAVDSSPNARNGVYGDVGKTTTTDQACVRDPGRAMRFDGASGYLSSSQITGNAPNTFTEAIWFKTTTTRGGMLIGLGNQQTGASGLHDRHLYMTDVGRIVFGVYANAARTVSSPASYRDGRWHQAVATLSAAGMRLYVDGSLVASDATTTTAEPVTAGYLRFGYDNLDGWPDPPTSRYFAGTLDDAAFYLSALTGTQIANQYRAGT